MMDDDHELLQCQLDLMHALQTRPPLRRVNSPERPTWIGGAKRSSSPRISALQSEFLASSLAMQMRLRPQLERMAEIKTFALFNEQWKAIQNELRDYARQRTKPCLQRHLQQLVEGLPGWIELQKEVREAQLKLEPVDYEGFYVVKQMI